jgi:cytochrome bd-type quinol oxidase subunit 2
MVSAIDRSQRTFRAAKLFCGVAAVALAHAGYVFVVYRSRVLTQSVFASSDFFLFALPALVAFAAYCWLLRAWRRQWPPRWLAAFVLTVVSFSLSLLVPFNTYGT